MDSTTLVNIGIPIISSIVGGSLVWLGQFFERRGQFSKDDKKSLLSIYAFCRRLEATMKNNYRELALSKTHVEYWWYCYNTSSGAKKDEYYMNHLRCQSEAREVERRIGDTKADFIGHVRKFQAMKPISQDIENRLVTISDLTHQKAKRYDYDTPLDILRNEMIDQDEKDLREIYYKNLDDFQIINDALQILIPK